MNESNCKGCGKRIQWGYSPNGRQIPLDPAPVIYRIMGVSAIPVERGTHMISHFITCPKANQFTGSKKKVAPYE